MKWKRFLIIFCIFLFFIDAFAQYSIYHNLCNVKVVNFNETYFAFKIKNCYGYPSPLEGTCNIINTTDRFVLKNYTIIVNKVLWSRVRGKKLLFDEDYTVMIQENFSVTKQELPEIHPAIIGSYDFTEDLEALANETCFEWIHQREEEPPTGGGPLVAIGFWGILVALIVLIFGMILSILIKPVVLALIIFLILIIVVLWFRKKKTRKGKKK